MDGRWVGGGEGGGMEMNRGLVKMNERWVEMSGGG